jgi:hypothetical protein
LDADCVQMTYKDALARASVDPQAPRGAQCAEAVIARLTKTPTS